MNTPYQISPHEDVLECSKYILSFKNKREGWGWLKRGGGGLKNFLPLEGGGRHFREVGLEGGFTVFSIL